MNFSSSTEIDKPLEDVWKIMAVEFDRASVWMASIPHSYATSEGAAVPGAPMTGRICELTSSKTKNMVSETITVFDEARHILIFEIVPRNMNRAVPFSKNRITAKLTSLGSGRTRADWKFHVQLKPHGYLLYPVAWLGFSKFLKSVLEELKFYAENGRAHPRKKHVAGHADTATA